MVQTRVRLTERQAKALRRISAATGRSVADLVREGVELYLGSQRRPDRREQVERALRVVGRFASGCSGVSTEHDRYLSQAFRS